MLAKCLYKCPQKGLLAFFTVVASSQIFPHTARWGSYPMQRYIFLPYLPYKKLFKFIKSSTFQVYRIDLSSHLFKRCSTMTMCSSSSFFSMSMISYQPLMTISSVDRGALQFFQ